MDVHRVRFIEHEPQSIHCLAFSDKSDSSPKLALSRGEGSIEIWCTNDNESFYKELWVPGRTNGSVETLVWCGGRLFTSGLTGILLEWDLVHLRPSQSQDSFGGAVWCMGHDSEGTSLAVGSEDGQVRLFDIVSNSLTFVRGLNRQEGRVLSLAWHPDGGTIAVGGADSTIRKIDVKSGHCVLRITLDEYKSRSTLVWDLKFLADSTIVSADSLGKVQLWNSSQGTLVQSCTLHSADVLALVVDEEENAIYSAGVDQKVVCLKRVKDKRSKWLKSNQVRAHSHDVRALALSNTGLLASGGVDTQLVTCPTSSFDIHSCIKHHPCPDSSKFFSVARDANVLVHQSNMSLKFWQLSTQHRLKSEASSTSALSTQLPNGVSQTDTNTPESTVGNVRVTDTQPAALPHCTNGVPKNFLEIKCKGPQYILSSAVSMDAVNVVLSTVDKLWLYHIDHKKLNIQCTNQLQQPSYKMAFTSDGKSLVLATIDNGVKIVDTVTFDLENAKEVQTKRRSRSDHPIIDFEFSPDNKLVAMSNYNRRISICSLESGEILSKVPRLDTRPTLFTFHPSCDELVLFTGTDKQLYTYIISEKRLTNVGRIHLDKKFNGRTKLSCPNGFVAVPKKEDVFAVYDNDCVALVRSSKVTDDGSKVTSGDRKRKRRSFEGEPLRYQFISSNPLVLFAAPFGQGELVIVERSWTKILDQLPPALVRDQYGT